MFLNLNLILILSVTLNLSADGDEVMQQVTVSGTVTDATTGQAMPGVNVVVAGTTIGTMTDVSGKFTLQVPNANARIASLIVQRFIELKYGTKRLNSVFDTGSNNIS